MGREEKVSVSGRRVSKGLRSMREKVQGAEKCFWWEGRRHVGVEGLSPHGVQL